MKDVAYFNELKFNGERAFYAVTTGTVYDSGKRQTFTSEAYEDRINEPGVLRWSSNDRCVPVDLCKKVRWTDMKAQEEANERDNIEFINQYIQAQAELDLRTDPEADDIRAEQDAERRAAFGPGVEVVDIITGKKFKT